MNRQLMRAALRLAPVLLLIVVLAVFAVQLNQFRSGRNLVNIIAQASSTGILAVGMTFVLVTAGVDLSVGAIMFMGAALAGKMAVAGQPLPLCLAVMVGTSAGCALLNAFFITRVRVAAFIVTLAAQFIWRGLSQRVTEIRPINLPDEFLRIGSAQVAGVPVPVWLFFAVLVAGHVVLTRTRFGRQAVAIGHDPEAARKAGVRVNTVLTTVYILSGICAACAAAITMGQLGTVSQKFGEGREFTAIAAAVLGGTSIFGGRGNVWGAFIGAVLIQSLETGLVMLNANPYAYPMVIAAVIFVAVLLESGRNRALEMRRTPIRNLKAGM